MGEIDIGVPQRPRPRSARQPTAMIATVGNAVEMLAFLTAIQFFAPGG
ncbi:hypothetical protein [Streptomyces sp. 2132.2]|nr:hypothetical protein [Streptomyces sp. 2132.2]